jgi:hypothetical protein
MSDYAHGCDRLCQVMTDWECYHYFKEFEANLFEVPIYASKCEPTAANEDWRRRLREEHPMPKLSEPIPEEMKEKPGETVQDKRRRLDHENVTTDY